MTAPAHAMGPDHKSKTDQSCQVGADDGEGGLVGSEHLSPQLDGNGQGDSNRGGGRANAGDARDNSGGALNTAPTINPEMGFQESHLTSAPTVPSPLLRTTSRQLFTRPAVPARSVTAPGLVSTLLSNVRNGTTAVDVARDLQSSLQANTYLDLHQLSADVQLRPNPIPSSFSTGDGVISVASSTFQDHSQIMIPPDDKPDQESEPILLSGPSQIDQLENFSDFDPILNDVSQPGCSTRPQADDRTYFNAGTDFHHNGPQKGPEMILQPHETESFLDPSNERHHNEANGRPSTRAPTYTTPQTPGSQSFSLDAVTATDDEPHLPRHFHRSSSDARHSAPNPDAARRLHRFSVYETEARFYIVGGDVSDQTFRVLTVHRDSPPGQLTISEDVGVYSKTEMNQLLATLDAGNALSGGIKLRCSAWGLLGFLRFTTSFYMLLVTKRTQVALIGGHMIYQVDGTELIPVVTDAESQSLHKERASHESRYLNILGNLNLNQNFYFSYAYNITQTLQNNIAFLRANGSADSRSNLNDMFVWNHHLLEPVKQIMENPLDWCLTLIHGFIGQASVEVMGRKIHLTVIARRSRLYAGARFLKRGVNDAGYVANDVETEQILSDMMTTSLHSPNGRLYANPRYTSYVQHRGSIPLFWSQDNSGVSPKPGIELNAVDPFYHAAALHFDNLFERYGTPIYVLNLIKARERVPRESVLLREYETAIKYLNQSLPEAHKILYRAFDMSRASKTRGQNVVETLETIAEDVLDKTGFFLNSEDRLESGSIQNGVARTNCIDCLDRTNAAQFVIAKCALGRQLKALGVLREAKLEYEADAVNIFSHIFHDHGDTIAAQYGGSYLVNTMATYRKINQWQSSSRDMVESFKRYYNNSFTDAQRQKAYNLFLGNYVYMPGQPMLWELPTDYYLHQLSSLSWNGMRRRHYIHWYTPRFLVERTIPPPLRPNELGLPLDRLSDFWDEYYRPFSFSSLNKLYSFRINTHNRYIRALLQGSQLQNGGRRYQKTGLNSSPFRVREKVGLIQEPNQASNGAEGSEKKLIKSRSSREFVSSLWPLSSRRTAKAQIEKVAAEDGAQKNDSQPLPPATSQKGPGVQGSSDRATLKGASPKGESQIPAHEGEKPIADRSKNHHWTIGEFYHNSLNPSISPSETDEYQQYIEFPHNMPLIINEEPPDDAEVLELMERAKMADASNTLLDYVTYLRMTSLQTKRMRLPSLEWPMPGGTSPTESDDKGEGSAYFSDDERSRSSREGSVDYSAMPTSDSLSTIAQFTSRLKPSRSTIFRQAVSQDRSPTAIPVSKTRDQTGRAHSPLAASRSQIGNDASFSAPRHRHRRGDSQFSTGSLGGQTINGDVGHSHSRHESTTASATMKNGNRSGSNIARGCVRAQAQSKMGQSLASKERTSLPFLRTESGVSSPRGAGSISGTQPGRLSQQSASSGPGPSSAALPEHDHNRQKGCPGQYGTKSAYDILTCTDPDQTTLQQYQDFIRLPHDTEFLNDSGHGLVLLPSAKAGPTPTVAVSGVTGTRLELQVGQAPASKGTGRIQLGISERNSGPLGSTSGSRPKLEVTTEPKSRAESRPGETIFGPPLSLVGLRLPSPQNEKKKELSFESHRLGSDAFQAQFPPEPGVSPDRPMPMPTIPATGNSSFQLSINTTKPVQPASPDSPLNSASILNPLGLRAVESANSVSGPEHKPGVLLSASSFASSYHSAQEFLQSPTNQGQLPPVALPSVHNYTRSPCLQLQTSPAIALFEEKLGGDEKRSSLALDSQDEVDTDGNLHAYHQPQRSQLHRSGGTAVRSVEGSRVAKIAAMVAACLAKGQHKHHFQYSHQPRYLGLKQQDSEATTGLGNELRQGQGMKIEGGGRMAGASSRYGRDFDAAIADGATGEWEDESKQLPFSSSAPPMSLSSQAPRRYQVYQMWLKGQSMFEPR